MDEDKDIDVSVAKTDFEESKVNVSEHVAAGENETRVVQSMVEVVGSHVSVDSECTSDGEGGDEGNSNNEEILGCGGSGEAGLRGADDGNDVVADPGSRDGDVSGRTLVEERVARESSEREKGGGDVVDETPKEVDVVLNDGAQNGAIETRVEGSATVLGSKDGATEVCMEDAVVITGEKGLEGGSVKEEEERCSQGAGSIGGEALEHGAENGVRSSTVVSGTLNGKTEAVKEVTEKENILGKEPVKGAEQVRGMDAGEEDACPDVDMGEVVVGSENASGKELIKSAESNSETDAGGEDAHQDSKVLDDKIRDPGIETDITDSLGFVEDSSVQTPVVEEAAVVVREEVLNVKDDDHLGNSDMKGPTFNSEEKQILMANVDDGQTGKSILNPNPELLDEQAPAAVSGDATAMDKGDFLSSTVEGMETDTFDENLSFSLEELQGNIERVDGSTENYSNVCADATPSCQPTQVVGDEIAAVDKKVHPNSENNQQLRPEGCLDQGTDHDIAGVDSNKEQAMVLDEQVVNSEFKGKLSGSEKFQDFKAETQCVATETDTRDGKKGNELVDNREALNLEGHGENNHLKHEESLDQNLASEQKANDVEQVHSGGGHQIEGKVADSTDNHRSDLVSMGQSTDAVVESEDMEVDNKAPSDLTVKFCSGNNQSLKAEVFGGNKEIDSRVMNGGEIALQASKEKVEGLGPAEGDKIASVNSTAGQDMEIEEQVVDVEQDGSDGGQEMEVEKQDSDTEQPKSTEEKFVKSTMMKAGSSVKLHQASYQFRMEDEGEFKVSDLVWGKVRSHPWWPGQIYDPSDASEKAMKYQKKDCFLVAYFGDRTFAWVDASLLKPFYSHFSQVEKQSNSEVFQNAVNCALEEVSRRTELGLSCSCIPNDIYDSIKFQMVENTGIRRESSMRDDIEDSAASASSFQPDKLVEYMKALAQSPSSGVDRLELVIAKAQLLSFYRLKGYCQLPEFQICGEVVERGVDNANPILKNDEHISYGKENLENRRSSHNKRKHNLKDSMYLSKKERSLSELMSGSFDSLDDEEFGSDDKATSKLVSPSSKKRKAVEPIADDSLQDGRRTISLAKVSMTTPQVPKPSFKIGECIRRAASQMTGSPAILKSNSERFQKFDVDGSDVSYENLEDAEGKRTVLPTDYSSLDDLLSQLHLAARDPLKGYSFLNIITSFFSDFRNSVIVDRHSADKASGKRKRSSHSMGGPETFEFEDMNDTYWTDRVIQNGGEEEQPTGRNGRGDYKVVPVELGKPVQKSRRSYSRKQYSDANHDAPPTKPPGYVDENAPAELVMNFSEVEPIPSETNLSKMFRRFGPIKESETEVDRETSRARVVFKRCADAEVAQNSAAKFNIFGPMVVNYQINYSISVPFKASSLALTLGDDMQLDVDSLGV